MVLEYAQALTQNPQVSPPVAAELLKQLSSRQMVELTVIIATANATTRIVNALQIEESL